MPSAADKEQLIAIYNHLYDWWEDEKGPITVWQTWGAVLYAVPAASYDRFKRLVRDGMARGHLALRSPGGTKKVSMSRMNVSITDDGADWWETIRADGWEDGASDGDGWKDYVGHRIRAVETPIPREVWQILMKKLKSGELDVAFLEPKTKIRGGS